MKKTIRSKVIELDCGWNIVLRLDEATNILRMDVMYKDGKPITAFRVLNARQLGWWIMGQTEMVLGSLEERKGE